MDPRSGGPAILEARGVPIPDPLIQQIGVNQHTLVGRVFLQDNGKLF
jgi:hypothetical protein